MSPTRETRRRLAAFALGLACLSRASISAGAEPPRIAILGVRSAGAPSQTRDRVNRAIAAGLSVSGVHVVDAAETARLIATKPALVGCETPACLPGIGEVASAPYLLRGWVELLGATTSLRLDFVEAASGTSLAVREESCESCTPEQLDETARLLAGLLRDEVLPTVSPRPNPSGKPVVANLQPPAAIVGAGSPAAPGVPANQAQARPRPGAWPWITAGVGVVSLGVGVGLLGFDGDGTCTPPRDGAQCPRIYDTTAGGITLLTLGVAAAAVGGFVLVFGTEAEPDETKVTLGPGQVSLLRRF